MTASAKRWIRYAQAATLAAGTAGVALSPSPAPAQTLPAQTPPPQPTPTQSPPASTVPGPAGPASAIPPFNVADAVARSLVLDQTTLRSGSTQAEREEAARRLINRQSPDADAIVRQVLSDKTNPQAQDAVARAIAEDPTPNPQLVDPLIALLGTTRELTQDAAAALAAYKAPPEATRAREALDRYVQANDPRSPQDATRAAAVRGMGTAADKQGAQTLIALLSDARQPGILRAAAADALGEMTHLRENGRDPAAWQKWWAANQNKPPDTFKADILDRYKKEQAAGGTDLEPVLRDAYALVPADRKGDLLRRYLASPDAGVRAVGVRLARTDLVRTGRDPGVDKPVLPRIRSMIGDSAPEARLEVAGLLGAINDRISVEPLLTQLAQEPDPTVRAAIVKAVQPMQDPRSVPALINLLDKDPSGQVVSAAAEALADLAPMIKADPVLAGSVSGALRTLMNGRGRAPGGADLRAAAVEALARLGDATLGRTFVSLLDRNESPRVRRAALAGLGVLADPNTAVAILNWLAVEEQLPMELQDGKVRLAALDALARVGTFAYADALFEYTKPQVERDASVREQAFKTIVALAQTADEATLLQWADTRLRRDFDHKVVVLQVAADKQRKAQKLQDLAFNLENIGDGYLKTTPPRPDLAAQFFRQALDYWLAHNGQPLVTQGLMREEVDALLAARQYTEAAKFTEEMIARDPANQPIVAVRLTNTAEDLLNARDARAVQTLATEALKIKPPLKEPYRGRLADAKAQADALVPRTEK